MVDLPTSIGPFVFGMPNGIWALLGILPLLILYLIRPKPKRMELPSLMFFVRHSGKSIVQSFLRTILRDFLFIIQFLAAIALLLTPLQPHSTIQVDVAAEHTVLVIDASASMQARYNGGSRFDHAVDEAKKIIGKRTTIILAKGNPALVARGLGPQEAERVLDSLKPTDTPSRIGEAMLLAGSAIEGDGRIVVFSDLDNTEGVDVTTAKDALQARGIPVAFVRTSTDDVQNIGIIDLAVAEDTTTAFIRNYGKDDASIILKIGDSSKEISIKAGSLEPVKFNTPSGVTEIRLEPGDAYDVDDTALVSAPEGETIKVLLITNDKSKFISSALQSSPRVDLAVSEPPIISKEEYDVYIVDNVDKKEVLPGTFESLLDRAKDGASVIIMGQRDSWDIKYGNLLPLKITGEGNETTFKTDQDTQTTRDLEFGTAKLHIMTEPYDDTVTLVSSSDNSTVIALRQQGRGIVAWYGILDGESDFKLSPDYPIFWHRLIRRLTGRADVRDLNMRTGESVIVPGGVVVRSPDGRELTGSVVTFETKGLYTIGENAIAVSALDARESSLRFQDSIEAETEAGNIGTVHESRDKEWEMWLIAIGAALLLAELIFLKTRGDV